MNPQYPASPQQQVPPSYQTAYDPNPRRRGRKSMIWAILATVLFLAALAFGIWAFSERSHFKNETQAITDEAVEKAVAANSQQLEARFAEEEKEPLKSYTGPAPLGAVEVTYPKTWSAYVTETSSGSRSLEGIFHPDFVPGASMDRPYALHIEILDRAFDDEVSKHDSAVRSGKLQSRPITLGNVPGVTGTRLDGELSRDREGSIVLFPLRDKTLILTVQATQYRSDFDNIILANLKFNP